MALGLRENYGKLKFRSWSFGWVTYIQYVHSVIWVCLKIREQLAGKYGFWSLIPRHTLHHVRHSSPVKSCSLAGLGSCCALTCCVHIEARIILTSAFVYVFFVLVLQTCHAHSNCICSICHGLSPLSTGLLISYVSSVSQTFQCREIYGCFQQ